MAKKKKEVFFQAWQDITDQRLRGFVSIRERRIHFFIYYIQVRDDFKFELTLKWKNKTVSL